MIKEVKMYTIVCDGCGKGVNDGSEFCAWNDDSCVQGIAYDSGWHREGDKNYCTDCHYYDDEENLIILSKVEIK